MNIRLVYAIFAVTMFLCCTRTHETEFGQSCTLRGLDPQKQFFSSDIDGSVRFFMDESIDKTGGKVFSGAFPGVSEGRFSWTATEDASLENCSNCIFLFIRDEAEGRTYKAESVEIEMLSVHHDTKGRVIFMRGFFERMVLKNIKEEDCVVIEKVGFVFY